MNEYVDILLLI